MIKFLVTKDFSYRVKLPYIPEEQLVLFSRFGLFKNGGVSDIRVSDSHEQRLYVDVTFLFLVFLLEQAYYFLPDLIDDICLEFDYCFKSWHYTVFKAKDSTHFMATINQKSDFLDAEEIWGYLTHIL